MTSPKNNNSNNNRVSISAGNRKMGAIPSVSLPPIITCPNCKECAKKCYAAKMCRIYPSVKKAYDNNLDILRRNPVAFWTQVKAAASMTRYFRFHVSGDIINRAYFENIMVATAQALPATRFLAFTKNYKAVNDYLNDGNEIPENLKIIFSEWGDMEINNPHKLPTAAVIFKGQQPRPEWKICGGNCAECACQGVGCWEIKSGETIAFYEH